MKRGWRCLLFACLACAAATPARGAPAAVLSLSVSTPTPAQGDPLVVRVEALAPVDNLVLVWNGAAWPMREDAPGRYEALIGVDLLAHPGPQTVAAEGAGPGGASRAEAVLTVVPRDFPVQELTLPERMAEFDAGTMERIREESRVLSARLARGTRPVLWRLPFRPPVDDFRPEKFGARRIINGEERSPHAAVDVRLPEGTPVGSVAEGTVAFAGEQFFGGRSVVIDHGGGVFSLYYHLRDFAVREGETVARGQTIGAVGATGRATGPHLHFGVRVPGGRVDPSLLFELPGG